MATRTSTDSPMGELALSRKLVNRAMTVAIYGAFAVALIPLVWLAHRPPPVAGGADAAAGAH